LKGGIEEPKTTKRVLVNETIGLKMHYALDQESVNYDTNAHEHRIT